MVYTEEVKYHSDMKDESAKYALIRAVALLAAATILAGCATPPPTQSGRPKMSVKFLGKEAHISGNSEPGKLYRLQRTDNLISGKWQDVGRPITATTDRVSFRDTVLGAQKGFYRIIVEEQ